MSDFDRALPFILRMEGGFVHDPDDKGGATNRGVTQKNYDQWRERQSLRWQDVKLITDEEVETIYFNEYWQAGRCDALPWPVSLAHFDSRVQHRPKQADEILQRATNHDGKQRLLVDGLIGPLTIAAVKRRDPQALSRLIIIERLFFYSRIVERDRTQAKFLKLWRPRMQKLLRAARG